jgi:membrane protein implicated in regulation of membrane protease activity
MEVDLLFWHWLVIGMVLVVAEMFVPTFFILWFGFGALVVGVVEIYAPMPTSMQILVWTVSSVLFAFLWFKLIKPKMALNNRGPEAHQSAIGQSGLVTKLPTASTQGLIRFTTPVLDKDEWNFSCETEVNLGDRLCVENVDGNSLLVTKLD